MKKKTSSTNAAAVLEDCLQNNPNRTIPIPLHKTQFEMDQITQHETRFTKTDKREHEQWPGTHQYRTVSKQNTLNTENKV